MTITKVNQNLYMGTENGIMRLGKTHMEVVLVLLLAVATQS